MKEKKPMTIEDLAERTDQKFEALTKEMRTGFEVSDKKFEALTKLLIDNVDRLENKMDAGFEKVNERFEQMEYRFDKKMDDFKLSVYLRFDRIDTEISDIKTELANLKQRTLEDNDATNCEIIKLQKRIDLLEKQYNELKLAKQ
jgi:hypothetical protein